MIEFSLHPRAVRSREWRAKNRERSRNYSKAYHADRYANDPSYVDSRKEASKWTRRKLKYGVTRDQYESLLAEQNGRCAICGDQVDGDLRVDHDHSTGEVRGLLCANCNAGIGFLQDNPSVLMSAAKYLLDRK